MRVCDGGESYFSDPDSEAATVTVLCMDGEEQSSYQTAPLYVRYTEWPTRVFRYASRVNDTRVQCCYISRGGDLITATNALSFSATLALALYDRRSSPVFLPVASAGSLHPRLHIR